MRKFTTYFVVSVDRKKRLVLRLFLTRKDSTAQVNRSTYGEITSTSVPSRDFQCALKYTFKPEGITQ
jgi:hypothetical protein